MKQAGIYHRKDGWYFHSYAKTSAGVWIGIPPYIKQPPTTNAAGLGSEALRALELFAQKIYPHPTDFDARLIPLLELAGVKTWGNFMKGTASIDLKLDDSGIEIIPMRNHGRGNHMAVDAAPIVIAADASPLQLGAAILRALELCD